jgi:UDP-glucose 4-epimerase
VVAVTGAASFLGANLVGVLEDEPSVRGIVAHGHATATYSRTENPLLRARLTETAAEERMAETFGAEGGRHHRSPRVSRVADARDRVLARVRKRRHDARAERVPAHEGAEARDVEPDAALRRAPTNPNFLSEENTRFARGAPSRSWLDKIRSRERSACASESPVQGATVTIPARPAPYRRADGRQLLHPLSEPSARARPVLGFEIRAVAVLHEAGRDRSAFRLAVSCATRPGVFNVIAPDGRGCRFARRSARRAAQALPLPRVGVAGAFVGALWVAQVRRGAARRFRLPSSTCASPTAGSRRKVLGYRPLYTSREALTTTPGRSTCAT